MDFIMLLIIISLVLYACLLALRSTSRSRKLSKLPPGPRPFPIIGNILHLDRNPHKSLAKLAKTYGTLMYLKFGSQNTIVVSSPEMAREILFKHDRVFSDRPTLVAVEVHDHHKFSIGCMPVGTQWRNIRKICKEQLFCTFRLDASQGLRREKLHKLRDYVHECALHGRVVNISEAVFITSLNLMSGMLFSVDFANFDSGLSQELKEIIGGMIEVVGTPNLVDFFPILKVFDPQGIKRKLEYCFGKLLDMFEHIIDQKLQERAACPNSPRPSDLLEALLDIINDKEYELSRVSIKHFLLDLFGAGTDSTAASVEWAMAELLRHPDKMSKAKQELKDIIGENEQVEEADISKLPYLQAVIKETLRCHPPLTFLVPHKARVATEINGYIIPENAQIIVNLYAIGTSSSVWRDPNSFEPERFLENKIDYKGQYFELIPFGSGRRICPGMSLAHRMVHMMLATLIHNFEWKLENGMEPEHMDMTDKLGLSLQKATPLRAVPVKA